MEYANFEIVRPLYAMQKKISSKLLKVGDRFIYRSHESLMFKTDAKPNDGKFLCCDESGNTEWIDGNIKVIKINGIATTINRCSIKLKKEFLKQDEERIKARNEKKL